MLLSSCGDDSSQHRAAPAPTLSQTSRVATHNSYWVNRGALYDIGASGIGERLTDQLVGEGVRTLELDVHPDPAQPHHFAIYHTSPGNDVCTSLDGCLQSVRILHWAEPQHSLVAVVVELKGLFKPTFDADHTPADLDSEIRSALGDLLWTPADLLARCHATSLAECVAQVGWPTENDMRGRVLVAVLGNWDGLPGAVDAADWATYATQTPIAQRAAFPMGSAWQRNPSVLSSDTQAALQPGEWEQAWSQVAVLQVESNDDPLLAPAVKDAVLVRADNAFVESQWKTWADLGAQWWQTDWPWRMQRSSRPVDILPAVPPSLTFQETLSPVMLAAPRDGQTWARSLKQLSAVAERNWQALIVSPYPGDGVGCLTALRSDDDLADGVRWCHQKIPAAHDDTSSDRAKPVADAERLNLLWTVCRDGTCQTQTFGPRDDGDVLRLAVRCDAGACCAQPYAIADVTVSRAVAWTSIADAACFAAELSLQGAAGRAGSSGVAPQFDSLEVASHAG
ncbi:MAG TPA: Ca2+-dependent phosphoinositide-specific phospholipase C [Candidatus Acidoferrales bacterium]|nr:Ca2+-dependent phosphoinositide-specific phospholipase C [Candidatus Acidoferrales bacterium]